MKRYKLLKNTPDLKAGTIFEESINCFDTKFLINEDLNYQFNVEKIDNFDEWFEEIHEEYKRWRAEVEEYYWNASDESPCKYIDYRDHKDSFLYASGNYFKTEAEAETYGKYLVARQILLDDAEGWKFTLKKKNHFANYSVIDNCWHLNQSYHYTPGGIYFKDIESLEKSLKEHKEQWGIIRKYEMGENK